MSQAELKMKTEEVLSLTNRMETMTNELDAIKLT